MTAPSPRLDAALAMLPAPRDDTEALRVATARGLLLGYHQRWQHESWQTEAVEQEFHVPIINPDTGRRSPLFTHAGKLDGFLARDGDSFVLEHKTCSEDISPGSWYWRRLRIDAHISGYLLAAWELGMRPVGVLYDVIRKPDIRPKKLGLADTHAIQRQ